MSRNLVVSLLIGLAIPLTAQAQDTPEIPGPPPAPSSSTVEEPADVPAVPEAPAGAPADAQPTDAPADAPADAEAAEAAPAPVDDGGAIRSDRRLAVGPSGSTGVLRVGAADSLAPGLLRVAFGFDFFQVDSFFESGDSAGRVGGILSVSGSPIDYMELWLNVRASSNTNDFTDPTLLQSLGDFALGIKGFYPVTDIFSIGADAQVTFLSGIGSASVDFGGTEARFRALFSADFAKPEDGIPLRLHFNVGYILDNSENLLAEGQVLTQPQRFALGINEYSRVLAGAAIELPFKYVTPYIEYTAEFPVSPQYLATPGVVALGQGLRTAQDINPNDVEFSDEAARPAYTRVIPQVITPGIRITAVPKFTFDIAVEIGITPDEGLGVPSVPPYNVWFLASYPLDPFGVMSEESGPPVAVPVVIPEAAPTTTGGLAGIVTDQETKAPIVGAVIRFDRSPPVATAESGRFRSLAMEPGPVQFTVAKEDYEPLTGTVDIVAGEEPEIEVALKPLIKEGTIKGRVLDDEDKPLADVTIALEGPSKQELKTDADGRFETKGVEGAYALLVEKTGYLSKAKTFSLEAKQTMSADILLRKRPEKEVVKVKGDRIFLQDKVHFVTGADRLAPDAASLLDNLVDFLVRRPNLKVRIEGHTDNVGAEIGNLELSRARAVAVKAYLTDNGVEASRLTTEGFGSSRPIAPNLTRRGREQNRRVEFHIEK